MLEGIRRNGAGVTVSMGDSDRKPEWFRTGALLRLGIAIVAAWIAALIAAAAGMPLLAVLVLALIISAGVFRILRKPESPT